MTTISDGLTNIISQANGLKEEAFKSLEVDATFTAKLAVEGEHVISIPTKIQINWSISVEIIVKIKNKKIIK